MKVLVVASSYPYPGFLFWGIFNKRSVEALNELCQRVEVLAPRPYVPPLLTSVVSRWKAYATMPAYEARNGAAVYRPATPVIPGIAQAFWSDLGAFLWCRRMVNAMHARAGFDAVVSFDLAGAGGLAWRIGRELGIPASGWATGDDVRVDPASLCGLFVRRAINNLDLVFYQSGELRDKAAGLVGLSPGQLPSDRHIVLPRGIPQPPRLPVEQARQRLRAKWGIKSGETVVLYVGRMARPKGVLELLDALALAIIKDASIRGVLVGSVPALDETRIVEQRLKQTPELRSRVTILPQCSPEDVWSCYCAADIFAFPSHNEGMPNSLLEAMAMALPPVAFAIPSVVELEGGSGGICLVPPLNSRRFADAILRLAAAPAERQQIGDKGKREVLTRFMVQKNMAEALRRLSALIPKRGGLIPEQP